MYVSFWNTFHENMGYHPESDELRLRFIGRWAHQLRGFPLFIELLHKLSIRRRDLNIVIRPHPSDSLEYYQCAFRGVPNVHVIREGTVAPWILASRVMLHDGCTTALAIAQTWRGCPICPGARCRGGVASDYGRECDLPANPL